MMYEEVFSKRLIQLRLEKGVSARDMSLSLGQSESYINRIENKQMFPSMNVFFYICEYFEITPQDFFSDGEELSLELIDIMKDLKLLDKEKLKHIGYIVKDMK